MMVVVLPCEPDIIIFFFNETILESISTLSYIGNFSFFASLTSGLLPLIADDLTSIVASLIFFFCPIKKFNPKSLQFSIFLFKLMSLPEL